jgi:hypothetical protein
MTGKMAGWHFPCHPNKSIDEIVRFDHDILRFENRNKHKIGSFITLIFHTRKTAWTQPRDFIYFPNNPTVAGANLFVM